MDRKRALKFAARTIIIVSLALGIGAFDSQPSFAGGCGAYCKAKQVRALCHDAVKTRGLEGHQRDVEFERCKNDPMIRKRIEELADDTGESFD